LLSVERGIVQIERMEVDEQPALRGNCAHGIRRERTQVTPELRHALEALRGIEERAGMGQGGLARAHQRLVGDDLS
jgi:hypothetical protein